MKRLTIGLISLLAMLIAGSALADVKQKTVPLKLIVYQIIELDVSTPETVIPTGEDYACKFDDKNSVTTCSTPPKNEYGFADRHDAIFVKMFTNARQGATVYFAGKSNPAHNRNLQLNDIYLTVMREKTYVLNNADCNPENATVVSGGIDGAWAIACTTINEQGHAKWIQAYAEAKKFFGVTEKTEATRLWVLKLGIGSLAEYEENLDGYEAELTFILMPRVV